jgi:uncharacterized phage-like protein YoqJ
MGKKKINENEENYIVFERTCGDELAAKKRVRELKKDYSHAIYLNSIPKGFNFMY